MSAHGYCHSVSVAINSAFASSIIFVMRSFLRQRTFKNWTFSNNLIIFDTGTNSQVWNNVEIKWKVRRSHTQTVALQTEVALLPLEELWSASRSINHWYRLQRLTPHFMLTQWGGVDYYGRAERASGQQGLATRSKCLCVIIYLPREALHFLLFYFGLFKTGMRDI